MAPVGSSECELTFVLATLSPSFSCSRLSARDRPPNTVLGGEREARIQPAQLGGLGSLTHVLEEALVAIPAIAHWR